MELTFTEEQEELAATVRSLLTKRADSAAVRAAMSSESGYDDELWRTLVEQIGAAALGIPEQHDGAGFSLFESLIVLQEVGRSLAPSPLLATLVATEVLLAGADHDARARLLPRIAAGEIATVALDPTAPVLDGDRAAIVLAVVDGDLVEVAEPGAAWAESMDQTVRLARLGSTAGTTIGDGRAALARAELVGASATTALQVGLADRALAMTVAYTQERVQFGRPIGSFQALKHRMADLHVLLEMSRSAAWAAWHAVSTGGDDAVRLTHVAKAYCSDALDTIAGETIQLHGGIAITWEHDAQLVFKRAHALGQLFGQAHEHRAALDL